MLEIRAPDGEPVAPLDGSELAWELEESRSYHLIARETTLGTAWLDVRELPRLDPRTFDLKIGFWTTAGLPLRVELPNTVVSATIRVRPRSDKLDSEAWLAMLEDLEQWDSGASVGATGGTAGRLTADGAAASGFATVALLPLVPALLGASRVIATQPREYAVEVEEEVHSHRVRRADGATLSWLARHVGVAAALDRWRANEGSGSQPFVPQWRSEDALDHPLNRYVAWALERARRRLERLAEHLAAATRHGDEDTSRWSEARATAARIASRQLADLRARTFLRRIAPAPPSESSLLALRDDPAYSRFHRLVRPFLSPRFAPGAVDGTVPTRPSYDIYELWTFVAMARALAISFPSWRTRRRDHSHESPDGARDFARTTFELDSEHGQLRLHFNKTFSSYHAADRSRPHSISGERRPDIVVEWRPIEGHGRWMFFDAKYRVGQRSLYDAFESIHIYQHALTWPSHGGRAAAGYLLVPSMAADTSEWFSKQFHATHACGCFVLRPGSDTAGLTHMIESLVDGGGLA